MNIRDIRRRTSYTATTRQFRRNDKGDTRRTIISARPLGRQDSTLRRPIRYTQYARRANYRGSDSRMKSSSSDRFRSLFNAISRYIMSVSFSHRTQCSRPTCRDRRSQYQCSINMWYGLLKERLNRRMWHTRCCYQRNNSESGSNALRSVSFLRCNDRGRSHRDERVNYSRCERRCVTEVYHARLNTMNRSDS